MSTLSTELRNKLERAVVEARQIAEEGARAALETLAVQHHEPYGHMSPEQRKLRNHLRARARQLGDKQDKAGKLDLSHIAHECGYEHWHRMLFARFLAENGLLIEPDEGVAVSLDDCKELAKEAKTDLWTLAGRFAQKMLPQIFRPDDPLLQIPLAKEHLLKLEGMLDNLPVDVFTANDSLGWCYQFWQSEKKDQVNASGNKIGADELPAVTQLFTEDYMVDFLLDNTLGAWWAGKQLSVISKQLSVAKTEEECRHLVSLPGCSWQYLRFVKDEKTGWRPAAGTFDGWPKTAKELKCLDPCMGSGHFVVAMFERMMALRMVEEGLNAKDALDAVIYDNIYGLEIDLRCTQIAAFNLALAAWRKAGYRPLPPMHIACSGLAPNTKKEEWLKLAGEKESLRHGMDRLYRLFEKAPVLGSLINPRTLSSDLLVAGFEELQPLLEKALAIQGDDNTHEIVVTAQGIAKAAEILAGQFALVATNVPFLGMNRQSEFLFEFLKTYYSSAKADLATAFIQRCLECCSPGATTAIVSPQIWLFLGSYKKFRTQLLEEKKWTFVARLGSGAFETISGEVVNVGLFVLSKITPTDAHLLSGLDVSDSVERENKATRLLEDSLVTIPQSGQLRNPDARVTLENTVNVPLLSKYADSYWGIGSGDIPRFAAQFWEIPQISANWKPLHVTSPKACAYTGREQIIDWSKSRLELCVHDYERELWLANRWNRGSEGWGKKGVAISQMGELHATLFSGEVYQNGVAAIIPKTEQHLPAIWAFCSSEAFLSEVRKIDKKLSVTNLTLIKVPFDLAHWQKVAAEKYPHGLPAPFSSDPTQWLFGGYPKGSDNPLHVAAARLLGYRWPRQTGLSFPDCPALKPDGLEKLEDKDGIACIPSVRGEVPAADRLLEVLTACGIKPDCDLDDWLRNEFFEEHCQLFHHRPFVWHIWDGRKRDGFHALVNYHKLAESGVEGRKVLESLTHSYLNDWITRQKDGVKRGEGGAEERLAAAQDLKSKLEAILQGEPPYDIFVRWKPLAKQPIGWDPDINDGVRLNIRPFATADILRKRVKIKWDKDRGKEPNRSKAEFPWFWGWDEKTTDFKGGKEFDGNRWNDCHYTNEMKRKAKGG